MELSDLDFSKTYTYADYLKWQFDERLELIKGKIFKMSPAPGRSHQEISFAVALKLGIYLQGKPCKAYYSTFDVRLPKNSNDDKAIYTVCCRIFALFATFQNWTTAVVLARRTL
jgi:Uma2 family endonuclease